MKQWWNNGITNKRSETCPGEAYTRGRIKFKRTPPSEETRMKMSSSLKGRIAWNRGLSTGQESESTKLKKHLSALKRDRTPYYGRIPWNKDKCANTDVRILSYSTNQLGQKRQGKYVSGNLHPNWNAHLKEFIRYKNKVRILSEENYVKHFKEINPNNFPRTLAGVDGGYQLDHIISIKNGFINSISYEKIANKNNLQMIPWKDNILKRDK